MAAGYSFSPLSLARWVVLCDEAARPDRHGCDPLGRAFTASLLGAQSEREYPSAMWIHSKHRRWTHPYVGRAGPRSRQREECGRGSQSGQWPESCGTKTRGGSCCRDGHPRAGSVPLPKTGHMPSSVEGEPCRHNRSVLRCAPKDQRGLTVQGLCIMVGCAPFSSCAPRVISARAVCQPWSLAPPSHLCSRRAKPTDPHRTEGQLCDHGGWLRRSNLDDQLPAGAVSICSPGVRPPLLV